MSPAPFRTAVDIADAVRTGRHSARVAVEDALARIEAVDGRIGAYQRVRAAAALREADAVDAREDRAALPLAGVPIAIKDNVQVAGEPMRVGSLGTDASPRDHDHEIVRRVRAAGAVVVGLTRVPELCVFGSTDSAYGITRNPWDPARTPGGSSGGSAAALAAGTVPIAHGNDGMGSIRIPSACCGLVGIKPGYGLVPSDLGNGSWFGMAENGAMATTVADAALLLSVLADQPHLAQLQTPASLRVAVSTKVPLAATPLDRHWAEATRQTAGLLRRAGHTVITADPPYGQDLQLREMARWMAGTELDVRELIVDRSKLSRTVAGHARAGRMMMRLGLPKEHGRRKWQQRAERFFADHDVLMTPGLAQPPIAAKAWAQGSWLRKVLADGRYAPFAAPWNVAGWPAMSVPAGLDPRGLPLAVQLVAPPGGEGQLLALAAQLEQLRPWPRVAESSAT
jgi:amidase